MDQPLFELAIRAATNATASNSTSTNPNTESRPAVYKIVGIILAVSSGLFIGTSFVLKKTGLLKANVKYSEEAGEGYGYLRNAFWWGGMTLMIIGEVCNFVAYAFVDAILVTPMGALSVVVTAILSAIFLKERLSFVGKMGCFCCIIGSIVIALNSPQQSSAATIQEMQHYVLSPGFLTYAGVIIVGCIFIAVWAAPKYGKKSMLVYLTICSLIGGLSVVATQGLGAAIVTQISGTPQFNQWFLYVLLVFVIATLLTEIIYLNKALNIFNAALVTPTYYVYFTSATIVTSAILFRGFKGTPVQIITIVMGFFQICAGVVLLQLSKSSKDVPDAAVFKGDLDQVRTIAEQEERDSEPKADVIRGASGLVRALSKNRLKREAEEAKRVHEERLQPIGENEVVEWDGLRRRVSTLRPGQSPPQKSKTVHYPLGLTHFPDEEESEHEMPDHHPNTGLFSTFRRKTTSSNTPRRVTSDRSVSYGSEISAPPSAGKSPVQLHEISTSSNAYEPNRPDSQAAGLDGSTEYLSDRLQVPARRQFSFQHVFKGNRNRSESAATADTFASDQRPSSSSTAGGRGSSVFGFGKKRTSSLLGPTEEERLGLVKGDATAASIGHKLSPIKSAADDLDMLSTPSQQQGRASPTRSGRVKIVTEQDRYDDEAFSAHYDEPESYEHYDEEEEDDWNGRYESRNRLGAGVDTAYRSVADHDADSPAKRPRPPRGDPGAFI